MIILRVVSGKAWSRDTMTQKHTGARGVHTTRTGIEFTSAMEFSDGYPTSTIATTLQGNEKTRQLSTASLSRDKDHV